MIATSRELLSRCSKFRTCSVDEFEHQLVALFGAIGFDLPDRAAFKIRSNFVHLHDLALGFLTFGTTAKVDFGERDVAALGLALRGHGITTSGTQTALAAVGRPTVASPGRRVTFHYGADLEKLFVRVKSEALERKLAALLGAPVKRRLQFELTDFTSQEMLSGLVRLVEILLRQLDDQLYQISPLALRELEEAVIVQLLFTGRHQLSKQLQQKPLEASPDCVKMVEEFIEAHWNHPITIEAFTKVTGVSARTLFRSFGKQRGFSPMVFVRKIRLEHAHALLRQPAASTSVTSVALACGFSSLGRFAHDYQTVFGELPSETLNRSRPPM